MIPRRRLLSNPPRWRRSQRFERLARADRRGLVWTRSREGLQDELTALGADPEPEVLAKAPYLEAVCNETLRLRPPSPGVGRKLNAPMQIAGC